MKLYVFPVAPNPTKVRLYLAEKRAAGARIDVVEEFVDLQRGEQRASAHLARNPLGRLPVLELDDGSFLTESLPIIEFLEELAPQPPMIGTDPTSRARVREMERLAEWGVLVPIARIVHATRSPLGLPPSPEIAAQAREALPEACRVIDAALADGREFVAGPSPTIADCTLAAALQFGRFGGVVPDAAFTRLADWDRRYRARPAAQEALLL